MAAGPSRHRHESVYPAMSIGAISLSTGAIAAGDKPDPQVVGPWCCGKLSARLGEGVHQRAE